MTPSFTPHAAFSPLPYKAYAEPRGWSSEGTYTGKAQIPYKTEITFELTDPEFWAMPLGDYGLLRTPPASAYVTKVDGVIWRDSITIVRTRIDM